MRVWKSQCLRPCLRMYLRKCMQLNVAAYYLLKLVNVRLEPLMSTPLMMRECLGPRPHPRDFPLIVHKCMVWPHYLNLLLAEHTVHVRWFCCMIRLWVSRRKPRTCTYCTCSFVGSLYFGVTLGVSGGYL